MEYDDGGGRRVRAKITAEEVISKLKDDGDFDALRLNLIRRIKENEELRNNIISAVKQSATLSRPGAENMKPSQLSDAIFEEIGVKVTGQISDRIWTVLRSSDGMKSEVCKTVESVCDKLINPRAEAPVENLSQNHTPISGRQEANGCPSVDAGNEIENANSDAEPSEPPGFSSRNHQQEANTEDECQEMSRVTSSNDQSAEQPHATTPLPQRSSTVSPPPSPSVPAPAATVDNNPAGIDDDDDDPDIPPGFG